MDLGPARGPEIAGTHHAVAQFLLEREDEIWMHRVFIGQPVPENSWCVGVVDVLAELHERFQSVLLE